MATTITAGNATNGAAISSDSAGTLDIKTGSGAGTTAISIDASQNVAITGTLTVGGIPSGGNYALVRYTSPTTWDATAKKAAGLKAIRVTVVGAGGAGAPSTPSVAASGGGGGGAAVEYVPVSNITPGTKTVTAGAGTNSFGPWGTATPNSPTATTTATAGAAGTSGPGARVGGAGGVGSGGAVAVTGASGGSAGSIPTSGGGGPSILGGGGAAGVLSGSGPVTGGAGGNYGGGGGAASNGPASGGAGAPGIVIVEEFY